MAIIGKNSRGGLAKTGGSTPVSSSSKAPAGIDVAGRKASLATIAKTNPALAASLSPLATGGVQTKSQSEATTKAIKANRPIAPVITPESLRPQTPVSLPKPPASTPVPDLSATNAGLVGGGITTDTTGKLIVAPTAEPTADNKYAGMQSIFDSYLKQSQAIAPVNNEAIYNAQYKADQIAQKQQAVNDITSQINTIVANRDADVLRVTGQGRGIPEVIIGGQQAQINKEAAIAALPLQAQLAAAQGNLDTAQSHLDTMFKIKSADATAKYNYNTKLLDSVFDFATKVEQNKIEDLKLSENRKYTEKQEFIKAQNDALKNALGQGAPASVYNAIKNATDINSVTIAAGAYNGDVLAQKIKAKQLADLYAPKGEGKSPWQMKEVNGVTSWVNEDTQEIKPVGGIDGSNLKPVKDAEIRDLNDTWTATNSIISIIDQMTESIKNEGTKVFWGEKAGERGANKTNLLLAMKNLEKTGALDKGTIDVLADLIPENEFWATEARQIASLNQLKDTISEKTGEFVGSYQGTTAEIDPRTKRIYGTPDISSLPENDVSEVYDLFGVNKSKGSTKFNADEWLK